MNAKIKQISELTSKTIAVFIEPRFKRPESIVVVVVVVVVVVGVLGGLTGRLGGVG
jgi:hypothetical protein